MVNASLTASANAFFPFPAIQEKPHSSTKDCLYLFNFQFGCLSWYSPSRDSYRRLSPEPVLTLFLTLGIFTTEGDKTVDARGLHGPACRKSAPRHQRHSQISPLHVNFLACRLHAGRRKKKNNNNNNNNWGLLTTSTWKGRSHASLEMFKPLSIRDHNPVFYSTSTSVK